MHKEPQDLREVLNVGDVVTFGNDPKEYRVMTVSEDRADFMPMEGWKPVKQVSVRVA